MPDFSNPFKDNALKKEKGVNKLSSFLEEMQDPNLDERLLMEEKNPVEAGKFAEEGDDYKDDIEEGVLTPDEMAGDVKGKQRYGVTVGEKLATLYTVISTNSNNAVRVNDYLSAIEEIFGENVVHDADAAIGDLNEEGDKEDDEDEDKEEMEESKDEDKEESEDDK